ncbi:MAG: right-handed parallel beta-helix repeat-containing protein [Capsulimonadaceae bacterium]|nr:right-handed parallel beta-helix repeat-containing protein [Capsulimonadaceae bacterium]
MSKLISALFLAAACLMDATHAAPIAGVPFDLQGYIDKAVASGQKKIVVPPGRYRITPCNRIHLLLTGINDTEIDASGVEMICTETTRAVSIANCANLTLRGLSIDYDPLPYTQGHITAVSSDKKLIDVEIFAGYPPAEQASNFKIEIFAPDTRTLRMEELTTPMPEVIDASHLRITNSHARTTDPEQVGDIIAIGSNYAPHGRIGHAVALDHCSGVRLEQINVWASTAFGFLENGCDSTTYYRCRIDRRPATSDIAVRADPRIRSLDADAFHSVGATKGPSIIECTAGWMGDDAVNIHGRYQMVAACAGNVLRVLSSSADGMPAVGEPVEIWSYDGLRLPDATVTSVAQDVPINDDEKAFLAKQRLLEAYKTNWNPKTFKVALDRSIDVPEGTLICSTRRTGNGFVVRGCTFGSNRSRGILIKASDGVVENNILSGSRGPAILVTPEYYWLEAGSSNNVVIRNNQISNCATFGILVAANSGSGKVAPAGAHNNIAVTGNTIRNCAYPNILVTSTDHVTITGNTCEPHPQFSILERALRGQGLNPEHVNATETVNCDHVLLQDNRP